MTHNDFTPHAAFTICNSGGIEIMLHNSGDGLYYRFNYGQDLTKEDIEEAEIFYTIPEDEEEESRPYFNHKGREYFLDEFLKV